MSREATAPGAIIGRTGWWWGWTLAAALLSPAGLQGAEDPHVLQFLQRPAAHTYANYAETPFKPYRARLRFDPRYNFFGEYLGEGYRPFLMDERRPGKSVVTKNEIYRATFQNLLVARSSYNTFNAALTIGDEIRQTLSPLTMQRAAFNGVRWEIYSPAHRLTLLASRGFESKGFPGFPAFSTPVSVDPLRYSYDLRETSDVTVIEENPVYTVGGRWETEIARAITFGATFVNQQQLNSEADRKDGFLRGGVPFPEIEPPKSIVLRFADDSPEDGEGGTALFRVVMDLEGTAAGVDTLLSSDPRSPHYRPELEPVVAGGRRVRDHREANGIDVITVTFPMPPDLTPRRARFRMVVANDYRIEVPVTSSGGPKIGGHTLRRAPGNVRDFSNQAEIGVDHGLNSGQSLYGVDFSADLVGLRVRGEIAANTLYRKFPVIGGHNDDTRSHAWYLNLLRTLPRFHRLQVGAEFFHIGPEYGGGYDSRRGGVVLWSGKADRVAEFPLVDDNDDGDRYPDDNVKDFFGGTAKEAGVFPGLDEDNDNIPDNDRNANGIPDYEEPFLLYDSDPQEFVYGLDMNNNGVIDARENDDKPEYPYDRDREGKHFTAAVRPLPGLELAAGYYRLVAITAGGRALSTYLRAVYKYSQPEHFTLDLNHDSKRVKDTIPDPVYVFHPGRIPEPLEPLGMPDPDPLLQQNSRVHTSFFGLRYNRFRPLNLETTVKRVYNRMFDAGSTAGSEPDTRVDYTMVNKVDYRWGWKRFVLRPMYKRLWQRVNLESHRRPLVWEVRAAPILRLDYVVSDEIKVQVGQQGFRLPFLGIRRGLAFRSIDKVESFRSYTSTDFLAMLTIKSTYVGTSIVANTGFHRHKAEFDDHRVEEKRKFTRLFVEVVTGFERF